MIRLHHTLTATVYIELIAKRFASICGFMYSIYKNSHNFNEQFAYAKFECNEI